MDVAEENLGRPVVPRNHILRVPTRDRVVDKLGDVEVDELNDALGIDHNVVHFDVPVPDTRLVHLREPRQHLPHQVLDLGLSDETWHRHRYFVFVTFFALLLSELPGLAFGPRTTIGFTLQAVETLPKELDDQVDRAALAIP